MSRVVEWVSARRWDEVCPLSEARVTWGGVVQQEQELLHQLSGML
jgi:hypothetical protein